ncbi:hypothetical protein PCANC_17165 [Puccinia coronata f. sp. avenae]|nr:hypothetical protein PCANC_26730 [Puccinia coronata f. sp. avenae]PLW37713.1 hypothetical protein PCANC_17165 [Puccinia coronata f. sp. avenae]
MASIYLEDVLAGQHLSPFTLGEFEEHLVHVQRSAENLYFYVWLADYTKQYREWEASLKEKKDPLAAIPSKASKPSGLSKGGLRDSIMPTRKAVVSVVPTFVRNVLVPKTKPEPVASQPQVHDAQLSRIHVSKDRIPDELRKSFEGLQTFVIPPRQSSQVLQEFELELNISEQLKDQFKHQAENSMDPEIFLTVKDEVRTMLSDSMRIWLMDCSGNSDRHRAQLTLCIGAFCVSLAVIGTVLFMVKTASVKIRLSLSPLVWIGLEIFFCGLFRTCPLIFMFGSFRQIHVWELGRAKEAAAITEKNLLSKRDDFLANRIKVRDSGQSCLHVPGNLESITPRNIHELPLTQRCPSFLPNKVKPYVFTHHEAETQEAQTAHQVPFLIRPHIRPIDSGNEPHSYKVTSDEHTQKCRFSNSFDFWMDYALPSSSSSIR